MLGISQNGVSWFRLGNRPRQSRSECNELLGQRLGRVIRGQPEGKCPEMPKATKCGQCRFRVLVENMNVKETELLIFFNAHRCSGIYYIIDATDS